MKPYQNSVPAIAMRATPADCGQAWPRALELNATTAPRIDRVIHRTTPGGTLRSGCHQEFEKSLIGAMQVRIEG